MIPIAKSAFGGEEAAAAPEAILSGWVTQSPLVVGSERKSARKVGTARFRAVTSYTTALQLALNASGIGAGDEAITVSPRFIAAANAIRSCAATPVFVTIDSQAFSHRSELGFGKSSCDRRFAPAGWRGHS